MIEKITAGVVSLFRVNVFLNILLAKHPEFEICIHLTFFFNGLNSTHQNVYVFNL